MSETTEVREKHTPGPWSVVMLGQCPTGVGAPVKGSSCYEMICNPVFADKDDSAMPQMRADMNLIAAAPDLLAACEAMMPEIDSIEATNLEGYREREALRAKISAAINKAKGLDA